MEINSTGERTDHPTDGLISVKGERRFYKSTLTIFQAVFAAILAVAFAYPGGLTGIAVSHGLGPIVAPAVVSAPVALASHATVIAQPIAPAVHTPAVVTRTVLAGHGGLALHG
ncbi:protein kinase [Lasius niger]|uniref:Protein kinase n=1 Tax=Lasius niger TaxID=67767 RepID=A0A0J7L626_LASNI|nr:protein kinase [Lasius niger]